MPDWESHPSREPASDWQHKIHQTAESVRKFRAMALGMGGDDQWQIRRGDLSLRIKERREELRELLTQESVTISKEIELRRGRFEEVKKWTDENASMTVYMEVCRLEGFLEVSAYDLGSLDSVFEWSEHAYATLCVNSPFYNSHTSQIQHQSEAKLISSAACIEDYLEKLELDYESPNADVLLGESIITSGLRDRAKFLKGLTCVSAREEELAGRGDV